MSRYLARSLLLSVTLFFASHTASAATFLLDLRGKATHWPDYWECITCLPDDPRLKPRTFDWVGVVTVSLAGDEDGVYRHGGLWDTSGDFISLSVDTNIGDFEFPWQATAVVSDRQIVALDAFFQSAPESLRLTGMTAIYDQPHLHHYGPTHATGIITNVPETSTWALMAVGLGAVAFAARRRRGPAKTA